MIMNDHIKTFLQYDPYSLAFTEEEYDVPKMHEIRQNEISKAKSASIIGLILGSLGR